MSDVIEPQTAAVETADIGRVNRLFKDDMAEYCLNHFGPDYKFDKTKLVKDLRKQVIKEIKIRLKIGKPKEKIIENQFDGKVDPAITRKDECREVLFRRFDDGKPIKLDPVDIFTEDGKPRYLKSDNNGMVFEANTSMISNIGKGFEICTKEGNRIDGAKYGY